MSYSISDVDWAFSTLDPLICPSVFTFGECLIYCRIRPYTVCRRTTPSGKKLAINAHRLALMTKMRTVDIPSDIQASHLCNRPGCIKLEHIFPEDKFTNEERKICHTRKICSGHGDHPDCIIKTSN